MLQPQPRSVAWIQIALVLFCLSLLPLLISGCSSRPQLYPNEKYKSVGEEAAKRDIEACEEEADKFVKSPTGKKMLRGAGTGAVVGGAVGAAFGLFTGNVGGAAASGAAMGGAGGAASGALSPNELKHRYVDKCLSDRGYQVLGWD